MQPIFEKIEKELPQLLIDESSWNSLRIDYHFPTINRLWLQRGEYRVYLHKSYPCKIGEALFHPHPWPSAIRVLNGIYEMGIGYGKSNVLPPVAAKIITSNGFYYEMTDPNGWHYIRPINNPTMSLMVAGKPWSRVAPKSHKILKPLSTKQKRELFDFFRDWYKTKKSK